MTAKSGTDSWAPHPRGKHPSPRRQAVGRKDEQVPAGRAVAAIRQQRAQSTLREIARRAGLKTKRLGEIAYPAEGMQAPDTISSGEEAAILGAAARLAADPRAKPAPRAAQPAPRLASELWAATTASTPAFTRRARVTGRAGPRGGRRGSTRRTATRPPAPTAAAPDVPMVDAAKAREHLNTAFKGASHEEMAQATGQDPAWIGDLLGRTDGTPRRERIRKETEQEILAAQRPDTAPEPSVHTPAADGPHVPHESVGRDFLAAPVHSELEHPQHDPDREAG